MKFKSDIEVQAGLKDSSGSIGASGQVLSSTGSNVSWINQTTIANDVQNLVKAGVAITKGQAVYVTGADGTNIIVGLASNTSEATSSKTLGLLNSNVSINGMADVVQIGRLSGLNTIGATAGDPVWLGTNGNLIYGLINKPYAPAHLVFIGIVTRVNANNGEIFVSVQNGFELNEIHDVDLKTNVPINGDVLGYDGTLWVNKTIAEWLGYTPANASGTTNYVSKFTGATTLGNSQIFDNGSGVGVNTSSPNYTTAGRGVIDINGSSQSMLALSVGGIGKGFLFHTGTDLLVSNEINGSIKLNTNGSEKAIITSAGNVGIGTTSPSQKLHVEGLSYFGSDIFTLNNGGIFFSGNNSYQRGIYSNASGLTLQTLGSPKVTITDGGNVGIGTTSPNYQTSGRLVVDINGSSQSLLGFSIGTNPSAYIASTSTLTELASVSNPLLFTVGSERMRITSSGNVGIGTTAPQAKLHINNGTDRNLWFRVNGSGTGTELLSINDAQSARQSLAFSASSFYFDNGNVGIGTTSPASKLNVSGDNITVSAGYGLAWSGDTSRIMTPEDNVSGALIQTPGIIRFNAGSSERMRITSGGNVGIGTTSPGFATAGRTVLTLNGSSTSLMEFQSGGAFKSYFYQSGTSFEIYETNTLTIAVGGSERMRVANNGNVGIGTTGPSAKLNVYGDLHLGAYSNLSTVNFENRTGKGIFVISTNGVTNAAGTTITYSWADGGHGPLKFNNASSEVMRLSANGNVGIGTTNTIHQLSVASKIGGATFGDSFIEFPSSGNTIVKANNDVILGYLQSTSIKQSGNIGVGIVNPSASAILHLKSNSQGFLPPVMSQSERDSIGAPEQGLMIFNTDTETVDVFTNGGGWKSLLF